MSRLHQARRKACVRNAPQACVGAEQTDAVFYGEAVWRGACSIAHAPVTSLQIQKPPQNTASWGQIFVTFSVTSDSFCYKMEDWYAHRRDKKGRKEMRKRQRVTLMVRCTE